MLVPFKYEHLYFYILSGYRFLQYEPHHNYGVIRALNTDRPLSNSNFNNIYIIPITDEQGLQMARSNIDLMEDFTFYISLEDHV